MKGFISVIIVSGRCETKITNTLKSLLSTKLKKDLFEIILVRDSSASKIKNKYELNNLQVITSEFKGMSRARNIGISKISNKSTITAFIDDDAVPKEDWIYEIYNYFKINNDKDFVGGNIIPKENKSLANEFSKIYGTHSIAKYGLPIGASMAFRTKLIKEYKYDEQFKRGYDDFDYVTRLLLDGHKLGFSKGLSIYHDNPSSLREIFKKRFESSKYSILYFNKYAQNPFNIEDLLIVLFLISFLIAPLSLGMIILGITFYLLLSLYMEDTKKTKIKMFVLVKLFPVFLITRALRFLGKCVGMSKWGFRKCRRS